MTNWEGVHTLVENTPHSWPPVMKDALQAEIIGTDWSVYVLQQITQSGVWLKIIGMPASRSGLIDRVVAVSSKRMLS
ncbi:hypothetical protein PGT21_003634 [Puccinia graminis f. sp. tritici]|nr:hypothetical protein PGT21_003634 [Puccinia graminis f. sp. tritici]